MWVWVRNRSRKAEEGVNTSVLVALERGGGAKMLVRGLAVMMVWSAARNDQAENMDQDATSESDNENANDIMKGMTAALELVSALIVHSRRCCDVQTSKVTEQQDPMDSEAPKLISYVHSLH